MSRSFYGPNEAKLFEAAQHAKRGETLSPEEQKLLQSSPLSVDELTKPLTPEEKIAVERKRQALNELLSEDKILKAKYKIELHVGKDRSSRGEKAFPGSLTVFTSGAALSGGGDTILYPCPDDRCPGFIPMELISSTMEIAGCPKCKQIWKQRELKEMRLFILPVQKWAYVLARYFIRLNHHADLYLKEHPKDIRSATRSERERDRGGTELRMARSSVKPVIYTLDRIYKDLANGAEIESRFRAFLVA
jgi:hypothetical protein